MDSAGDGAWLLSVYTSTFHRRHLPRVAAVVDWLDELFGPPGNSRR